MTAWLQFVPRGPAHRDHATQVQDYPLACTEDCIMRSITNWNSGSSPDSALYINGTKSTNTPQWMFFSNQSHRSLMDLAPYGDSSTTMSRPAHRLPPRLNRGSCSASIIPRGWLLEHLGDLAREEILVYYPASSTAQRTSVICRLEASRLHSRPLP